MPEAITAMVAPAAASAPSWAAVSMPRARPEMTTRPAGRELAGEAPGEHAAIGAGVAGADDGDAGAASSSTRPCTISSGGGSAISARRSG